MPYEEDFAPDADGLREALRMLIEVRSEAGSPHINPALPLDVPQQWPAVGLGGMVALEHLKGPALEQVSRLDHPGFFAHMDPPTPWMTWAAAMWAAAMNQNLLHPDAAPGARQLEPLVVGWLAPAFGMRGGHLLPGSTLANLTALWAARDLTGARRVVCSVAAHLSIAKAARVLGLELVEVPVDDHQRLREDLLPDDVSDAVVVLTAGTVATGAVDPLSAARGAAWRHVDAAWAGPLRLSSHARLLDGIDTADSVAVSAHKWLYQPKDSALVLFREPQAAQEVLSFGGSYLAAPNVGLLGSSGDRALPLGRHAAGLGPAGPGRPDRRGHGSGRAAGRLGQRRAGAGAVAAPGDRGRDLAAPPRTGRGSARSNARRLGQHRHPQRRDMVSVRRSQPARPARARRPRRPQRADQQLIRGLADNRRPVSVIRPILAGWADWPRERRPTVSR